MTRGTDQWLTICIAVDLCINELQTWGSNPVALLWHNGKMVYRPLLRMCVLFTFLYNMDLTYTNHSNDDQSKWKASFLIGHIMYIRQVTCSEHRQMSCSAFTLRYRGGKKDEIHCRCGGNWATLQVVISRCSREIDFR